MTAKVILVMIVRDEAPILSYRLRCLLGDIDAFCVVDTGSVDETKGIVIDVLKSEGGLPGVLLLHEWAGFADARSMAVRSATDWVAGHGDGDDWWALLLDADTVARLEPGWRKALVGDVVECDVRHDAMRYVHPRLLRLNGHGWRWRGVVHEFLEVPGSMRVSHAGERVKVEHGHGGARERKGAAVKYRSDAELIAKTRAEGAEPDLDARYCFYEAQSWRDCGEVDLAIGRYMERGRMGGWPQEIYMSHLRAGELLWSKQNWPGAYACWTAAWATDPSRAEAVIGLASLCRARAFWVPALTFGQLGQRAAKAGPHGLFADVNVSWRAEYEVAIAGSWVGTAPALAAGRRACLGLAKGPDAPPEVRAAMAKNLEEFYPAPKRKR